ncbi:Hsp20/alpha crystallin family protein [Sinomonas halotolerans]|uniref:Hsp20/alpha crystallin family protein n=1 Tax=Sinomonas halotolerans TaxID=1644133 RepID=A0ABU9WZM3_9MICC
MADFDPIRELDRFASTLLGQRSGMRLMPIDLFREGDHYIVHADLPGIDPGSVDIDVDGQLLTIRAERTVRGREGVTWIAREREGGTFLRQLTLGQGIDTEHITATYSNGVLAVTIPVSERARPRRIPVATDHGADTKVVGQTKTGDVPEDLGERHEVQGGTEMKQ